MHYRDAFLHLILFTSVDSDKKSDPDCTTIIGKFCGYIALRPYTCKIQVLSMRTILTFNADSDKVEESWMNGKERTQWQPITLPGDDGRTIYFEIVPRGGREKVGILESIPFDEVTELLTGIANGIGGILEKVKPKKANIELGVEFGLESGKLVAFIARGTGKANLKIGLEWERS